MVEINLPHGRFLIPSSMPSLTAAVTYLPEAKVSTGLVQENEVLIR